MDYCPLRKITVTQYKIDQQVVALNEGTQPRLEIEKAESTSEKPRDRLNAHKKDVRKFYNHSY